MTSIMEKPPVVSLGKCTSLVPIDGHFISGVKAILHSAVERLDLFNAASMLRSLYTDDSRYLIIGEQLPTLEMPEGVKEQEFFTSTELPISPRPTQLRNQESVSMSINFNEQRLGYLVASTDSSTVTADTLRRGLEQTAAELVAMVKRYQTRHNMLATFGPQPFFIGYSRSLRQLDQQIDKLADAPMPIVIRGDKGTGKLMAARALHCHQQPDFRPFIESSCEDWEPGAAEQTLLELWAYARGGSLFLRNIDKLPYASLLALQEFWRSKTVVDVTAAREVKARLMVSLSSSEPFPHDDNHPMEQWLEFNFLELRLPTLCERRADIRTLARYFIDEYRLDMDFDFSEDAWQLLEAFHWPENGQQLKRLIQKLAILVEEPRVSAALLLQLFPSLELHEPGFFSAAALTKAITAASALTGYQVTSDTTNQASESNSETAVTPAMIFGGLRDLKWEHPLLVNAVTFMINNHSHEIDLLDAATSTGISATQLADLLRHRLGLSFHQVMNKIRVEQAKAIFQNLPAKQVTQVCREIGFNDIAGFEKIFKRMVGISPKVYRGQFFKPLSLSRQ